MGVALGGRRLTEEPALEKQGPEGDRAGEDHHPKPPGALTRHHIDAIDSGDDKDDGEENADAGVDSKPTHDPARNLLAHHASVFILLVKQDPFFAVLNAPDGTTLAVGLGRTLSVLSYTAPGGWPAQHVVNSNAGAGRLTFKFLGHFTEIPSEYAVPLDDALDAAADFFLSGKLTEKLAWEND